MNKVFLVIIILTFSLASFFISYKLTKKDTIIGVKKQLPLPEEFITAPALQQLNANIKGSVVEKTDDYFVLEENARKVKLFIEPRGLTTFAFLSNPNNEVEYENIKIGDSLKGGVSIIVSEESAVGMSAKMDRGDIIAHYFIVQNR